MPNAAPPIFAFDWRAEIDHRAPPELYRVGKGEQGVLICEPYKSELLHWRFPTPVIAAKSCKAGSRECFALI